MEQDPNPTADSRTRLTSRYTQMLRKGATAEIAHYLVVTEGTERDLKLEIGLTPITIGRHSDNRLTLADPFVSGHHCVVSFEEGQIWVTDRGSTNGTYIEGAKVVGRAIWPIAATLQVGKQLMRQEYRRRDEVRKSDDLADELRRASTYVRTLLPAPIANGPLTATWKFTPSAGLGGDIFDYFPLGTDAYVIYLLDVCGHGVGAALHSVSVFNLIRRRALAGTDFLRPAEVLTALNRALPMESFAGMYSTLWYGVYRPGSLTYASAGHPPAIMFNPAQQRCQALPADDPPLGIIESIEYFETRIRLPTGCKLFLYSDGAYELCTRNGEIWRWEDFLELLDDHCRRDTAYPDGLYEDILSATGAKRYEDDFSLLRLDLGAAA